MLTQRQFDLAANLFDLDPVSSYPERGGRHIADLVGATGYRLELGERLYTSAPKPMGAPQVSIDLCPTAEGAPSSIGTIHLYGPTLGDAERRLAEWAAGLLAQGVRFAQRLDESNHERTYEDVQAMLERTPLTPRERDVVGRLLSGASTRQIAQSTGLTIATVNTYLKRIFAKLGVHSRVELVARVTGTRGVIPSETPSENETSP